MAEHPWDPSVYLTALGVHVLALDQREVEPIIDEYMRRFPSVPRPVLQDDPLLAPATDLGEATGLAARPVATEVTRWIGGLPQYPVGHLARVARIRDEVAKPPGLRVCGAAYDGVGIPACIAGAQRAADEILATPTLARGTDRGAGE